MAFTTSIPLLGSLLWGLQVAARSVVSKLKHLQTLRIVRPPDRENRGNTPVDILVVKHGVVKSYAFVPQTKY